MIETAVIRHWSGRFSCGIILDFSHDPGGFVVTYHQGTGGAETIHKINWYETADAAIVDNPNYTWLKPDPTDEVDIVMVGINLGIISV